MKLGILGGGLTGISLAYFYKGDSEVIEKENQCGGLCTSFNKNGFNYDIGGHIMFSKDIEILNFMVNVLEDNVQKNLRKNKIWYKNRYVKYPFENGLFDLDKKDNFECLYYYLKNKYSKPKNFKEWIYYTFGKGIAEKYLIPYNEKIWNIKTNKMGIEWVERIPKPPMKDVIKSAIGIPTEGYKHQLHFYYPKVGGIQSLIKSIEKNVNNIDVNFEIKSIKNKNGKWIVSDGKKYKEFDTIVSTIPIFDLASVIEDVPEKVKIALSKLKYNSIIIVLIGVNKSYLSDKTAIYIPDTKVWAHRLCYNKCFSSNNVPEGKSSLIAEVTVNDGDKIDRMADYDVIEKVANQIHKEGFINKNDICETDIKRIKYAYVIYTIDYQKNIKVVYDYFNELGIKLCGRFSEFKYINMDACIRRAKEMSLKLMKDIRNKG